MVATSGIVESTISEEISAVLAKQNAEEEFLNWCASYCAGNGFPKRSHFVRFWRAIRILRRDWMKVMMRIILPHSMLSVWLTERTWGYYHDLVERLPRPQIRTCIRYLDYEDTPDAVG